MASEWTNLIIPKYIPGFTIFKDPSFLFWWRITFLNCKFRIWAVKIVCIAFKILLTCQFNFWIIWDKWLLFRLYQIWWWCNLSWNPYFLCLQQYHHPILKNVHILEYIGRMSSQFGMSEIHNWLTFPNMTCVILGSISPVLCQIPFQKNIKITFPIMFTYCSDKLAVDVELPI